MPKGRGVPGVAGAAALLLALSACASPTHHAASPQPVAPSEPEPTFPEVIVPTTPSRPPRTRTPSPSPLRTTVAPPPPPATVSATGYDYVFPVARCAVSYAHAHHDYPATDIFAAKGCAFVAPVEGRVDEVSYTDTWNSSTNKGADRGGLSVSVVGVDGVRYYGSHLSAIAPGIRPGVRVRAGARLGSVGNTGSARGIATHLHFGVSWPTRPGVWWVRRGEVYPWPYLDSWRAGGDRSPVAEVTRKRAAVGVVPPCPSYC